MQTDSEWETTQTPRPQRGRIEPVPTQHHQQRATCRLESNWVLARWFACWKLLKYSRTWLRLFQLDVINADLGGHMFYFDVTVLTFMECVCVTVCMTVYVCVWLCVWLCVWFWVCDCVCPAPSASPCPGNRVGRLMFQTRVTEEGHQACCAPDTHRACSAAILPLGIWNSWDRCELWLCIFHLPRDSVDADLFHFVLVF